MPLARNRGSWIVSPIPEDLRASWHLILGNSRDELPKNAAKLAHVLTHQKDR